MGPVGLTNADAWKEARKLLTEEPTKADRMTFDTDLLFPCRLSNERPISGWSKFKKQLDDGVPGWTLHDLRRTYRSTRGQIGTPSEIAERLINHAAAVQTEVEEIYDRWHYLPQMQQAVLSFEDHFISLLSSNDRVAPKALS